jgi:hypothetical protein
MTPYPLSYPCPSRIEGHSAAIVAGLVRTPMTAGNSRQRRAFRNLPHTISLVFMIDQGSYASWLSWVNTYAWDDWIEIGLPGLHASSVGEDVTLTRVRFVSDLQAELLPVHRLWYWRVRVLAEYEPVPDDFPIVDGKWIIGRRPGLPAPDWVLPGTPAASSGTFTNPGTPARPVVVI